MQPLNYEGKEQPEQTRSLTRSERGVLRLVAVTLTALALLLAVSIFFIWVGGGVGY